MSRSLNPINAARDAFCRCMLHAARCTQLDCSSHIRENVKKIEANYVTSLYGVYPDNYWAAALRRTEMMAQMPLGEVHSQSSRGILGRLRELKAVFCFNICYAQRHTQYDLPRTNLHQTVRLGGGIYRPLLDYLRPFIERSCESSLLYPPFAPSLHPKPASIRHQTPNATSPKNS
jgi:hypothetical protein